MAKQYVYSIVNTFTFKINVLNFKMSQKKGELENLMRQFTEGFLDSVEYMAKLTEI